MGILLARLTFINSYDMKKSQSKLVEILKREWFLLVMILIISILFITYELL